jgi:glyoxylase-like metal-dependent hydrolase (beta-lactamase superfamily II)
VIKRLTLAVVTAVPDWHPQHASFTPFPVHAWVIRHPDGVLLVDTGIGPGNSFIDELYRPRITPLADALGSDGLAYWATIPDDRLRLVDGDDEIAAGVRLISTPGHTPGHQSVLVETADTRVVLAAQCAFGAVEVRSGEPAASNLHDDSFHQTACDSLRRLRTFAPVMVELSHDREIVTLTT